jgi:hypothetical protein
MEPIITKAPISLEHLKVYFQDKSTRYLIDYANSDLKGETLLIYLGNLDLPCDIIYDNDESLFEMVEAYLKFNHIVNIESLEHRVIDMLFQRKGIKHMYTPRPVEKYGDLLDTWIQKLESLSLFNLYIIDDESFKDFASSQPLDDTDSTKGINFVSLLKHQYFYTFYEKIDQQNLKYYAKYFNEYMFKGQNLYAFWANENNPMFLLTWGIATGNVDTHAFIQALKQDQLDITQGLANVSPDR